MSLDSDFVTGMLDSAASILRNTEFLSVMNSMVPPEQQRHGCYLTILDKESEIPLVRIALGKIPADRKKARYNFSLEKAHRLQANPGHVSSWQSRDFDNEKYGGAIRASRFLISTSGFPEFGDECYDLIIGQNAGLIEDLEIDEILAFSGNAEKFERLQLAARTFV